eukprot:jgi/Botrbrau1/105/Bobra.0022s0094.1
MSRRTEMTDYEKQRAEVISRNQAMLAQLKVSEAAQSLTDTANKTGEPARKKARRELLQAELSRLPSRQSTRTTAQATKAKLQQQVASGKDSDDEERSDDSLSEDNSSEVEVLEELEEEEDSGMLDSGDADSGDEEGNRREEESDGRGATARGNRKGNRVDSWQKPMKRGRTADPSNAASNTQHALYSHNLLQLLNIDLVGMGVDPDDHAMVEVLVKSCVEANGLDLDALRVMAGDKPGQQSEGGEERAPPSARKRPPKGAQAPNGSGQKSFPAKGKEPGSAKTGNSRGKLESPLASGAPAVDCGDLKTPQRLPSGAGNWDGAALKEGEQSAEEQEKDEGKGAGTHLQKQDTPPGKKESAKRRRRRGPRFEPPTQDEVEEAFRFLDPQGLGFVGRESIVQVFRTLQGRELSDHEVDIMFGAAQALVDSRRGRIDLPAFQSLVALML